MAGTEQQRKGQVVCSEDSGGRPWATATAGGKCTAQATLQADLDSKAGAAVSWPQACVQFRLLKHTPLMV